MHVKEFCGTFRPDSRAGLRIRNRRKAFAGILSALALFLSGAATMPVLAQVEQNRCENAARAASEATGVPFEVLMAITLTETGRRRGGKLRPWPWTVNMEGEGRWFTTRDEALNYVLQRQAAGARSFDIGCFQLNHKWHGDAFPSIERMFDPVANATYAAAFLQRLHARKGSWELAAAAYHSATPVYAERYRKRFVRILAGLEGGEPAPVTIPAPERRSARANTYPLLQRAVQAQAAGGSLVFLDRAGSRSALIGAARGRLF